MTGFNQLKQCTLVRSQRRSATVQHLFESKDVSLPPDRLARRLRSWDRRGYCALESLKARFRLI